MPKLTTLVAAAGGIRPAERRTVSAEYVDLPPGEPDRWKHGYVLRGLMTDCRGVDDTAAPGALKPGSVHLRDATGPLRCEADFRIDEHWAVLTRTRALVGPVLADYEFSLLRVDALVTDRSGPRIIRGHSHLSNPAPPPIPPGCRHLATLFMPYFGTEADAILIPVTAAPRSPISRPQLELLPAVQAALHARRALRITCWGDSVTAGGSASSERTAYPMVLGELLVRAGLSAEVTTVAIGGSATPEWLVPGGSPNGADWRDVAATRPDLITLEFVNDAELDPADWPELYGEIRARTHALGADLLLLEPHFTRMDWMRIDRLDAADPRPYVAFLREFARRERVAIAAVSRRWERLYAEGVAFSTLLRNGINHPDDRGHRIYAEEAAATLGARTGPA